MSGYRSMIPAPKNALTALIAAPRVRGSPADERVVPEVAVPRIARGETMMRHAEPFVVGRGPDRLQVRMVDGNAFSQVGIDICGPWRARPCFDFFHRRLDGSAALHNVSLQAARVLAAEVIGKAVVGMDKPDLDRNVIRGWR